MALEHLSKEQFAFLQLTTESGSPYHPFVKGLRRLLRLPEIVDCKTRKTEAGQIVEPTREDEEIVMHHHLHEAEQGPLYTKRIEALEVLFNGPKPEPKKEGPPASPTKGDPKKG